ncbi:unnamed protein product [Microthlaspi erraticum]|uniref:Uncharacterized protein n=1 Tax=Microthlaspi erraticum TaxID=1685480 RepID=A0A6D2IM48_9BRAS|nr:unnamed protein product [Microthlaspi erraticum]
MFLLSWLPLSYRQKKAKETSLIRACQTAIEELTKRQQVLQGLKKKFIEEANLCHAWSMEFVRTNEESKPLGLWELRKLSFLYAISILKQQIWIRDTISYLKEIIEALPSQLSTVKSEHIWTNLIKKAKWSSRKITSG